MEPDEPIDSFIGYLIQRRRSLTLLCWRCERRSALSPEQLSAAATRGPDEPMWRFVGRCRCIACQTSSPKFGYEGEPRPMLHGKTYTQRGTIPWGDR